MVLLALLLACYPDPEPAFGDGCVGCHGSEETGPAPPTALGGFTDSTNFGVGAHASHVLGTHIDEKVSCTECHLVPTSVEAEGHTDTPWPAEVPWGELAKTDGAFTGFDRTEGTCTVYCHGASLSGGEHSPPSWTVADGSQVTCGSCHGSPPPAPHPASPVCADCHGALTPETHIDGKITWVTDTTTGATHTDSGLPTGTPTGTVPSGCDTCHGQGGDPAPPPDTTGSSSTSSRGVGAHQTHLGGGSSSPVTCVTCHVVPAATGDAGHLDAAPAEVNMAGIAAADGVSPSYDGGSLSCSTYCHGVSLAGGSNTAPVWTTVDGSQSACGSCHGLPPPAPHPGLSTCDSCHPPVSATTHINGVVDF